MEKKEAEKKLNKEEKKQKLEEKIYKYIKEKQLLKKGENIVLAISGGPDSVFMLYMLDGINKRYNLNLKYIIANLNHNIREESIKDTEYVKNLGKQLGIDVYIKEVDIPEVAKINKQGLEEAGRIERYKFFDELGKKIFKDKFKIATAHHLNDNTESILINTLRGSGLDGLTGIKAKVNNIIRPILFIKKQELQEYLDKANIKYMVDHTNFETNHTRNSIRNKLIPFLEKEYNPRLHETLGRMAEVLYTESEFLDKLAEETLEKILLNKKEKDKKIFINEIKIKNREFKKIDRALRLRIIRLCINKIFGSTENISKINYDEILTLSDRNIGSKYKIINKRTKVSLKDGILTIKKITL